MEVLLVGLDVFGEVLDLFREDSDLNADVTGVLFAVSSAAFSLVIVAIVAIPFFVLLFHHMFLSEFLCSSTSGIGESGHRTQAKMQFELIYRKLVIS